MSPMSESSLSRKLVVVGSFIISFVALYWLLSFPNKPLGAANRLGYLCAVLCALGAACSCWATGFAYVTRKRNWSLRTCRMAGLFFMVPGLVLLLADARIGTTGTLLLSQLNLTGYVCAKLAYPELSVEEIYAPEKPLSLFGK